MLGLGDKNIQNNYLKTSDYTMLNFLPYNLLISNKWFVLIPRSKEGHKGFSLNAIGYAGFLLATAESNLAWLHENGPSQLLAEAAIPTH